ncbi:Uncharacterised protein [Legionella beliardensis]|uniref:Uncharacterized protein n=1 Tax=Legionella beliardensis TaxID=91822 RepID=A0A378I2W5_9GAMM|nr:hypothetical protein [Legionella beliardensis]STX29041.1 Uncharacterised protein [Legionella beliardensis]
MVNKVTLIYGTKTEGEKATLVIYGVHNQEAMSAVFVKGKLGGTIPWQKSFNLEKKDDIERIKEINEKFVVALCEILDEIENHLAAKDTKLIAVEYQGDVNLGFNGEKFPDCLLNSTIHQLFKEREFFKEAKINLTLISATPDVVDAAEEKHKATYADNHERDYPGSPVVIRHKGWKLGERRYSSDEYVRSEEHMLRKSSPEVFSKEEETSGVTLSQSAPQVYAGNPFTLFTSPSDNNNIATVAPSNSEPEETSQVLSKLSIG